MAAFGAYTLPRPLEHLRLFGQRLGRGSLARRVCSLIRRVITLGNSGPFDVEPFPGQAARLYPGENLSDKRVFGGAQFWDWDEREALRAAIADGSGPFVFIDAGANAGLYTLAVRSAASGRALRAIAIEADPENARRLSFNIEASNAGSDVEIMQVALSDQVGTLTFAANHANRGELSIAESGTEVEARPLLDIAQELGLTQIDALKIDIEGMEHAVLQHFLDGAPRSLWPRMIIAEARRGETTDALDLLTNRGYRINRRTRLNVVLERTSDEDGPGGTQTTGNDNVQA